LCWDYSHTVREGSLHKKIDDNHGLLIQLWWKETQPWVNFWNKDMRKRKIYWSGRQFPNLFTLEYHNGKLEWTGEGALLRGVNRAAHSGLCCWWLVIPTIPETQSPKEARHRVHIQIMSNSKTKMIMVFSALQGWDSAEFLIAGNSPRYGLCHKHPWKWNLADVTKCYWKLRTLHTRHLF
jgi:hypothetical protein